MDNLDQAQLRAYRALKNSKKFAAIYAFSLGKGDIFLTPVQLKDSQEDVQRFVDGFKRTKNSATAATVKVLYRSQLDTMEYSLKQRGLLKEGLLEDIGEIGRKVRIVNADIPFKGLKGTVREEDETTVTLEVEFPTSNGIKTLIQTFDKDVVENI